MIIASSYCSGSTGACLKESLYLFRSTSQRPAVIQTDRTLTTPESRHIERS